MDLDDLNARVTTAILRAERLPAGSPEAEEAFREVGLIEEEIASLTPPDDLEGEIARLGAVTAALSAGDPLRALLLVERYRAEAPSTEVARKLETLRAQADHAVTEALSNAPPVQPLRFTVLPHAA